jgi:hypothetical protein
MADFGYDSAWSYDETTGQYFYHAFLPAQPDLNWRDAIAGHLQVRPIDLPSRLWSHPTIWTYLANAIRRRVL